MQTNHNSGLQPRLVARRDPGWTSAISPYHILAITIGGIFVAEIVAMVVIYWLPALSYPVRTLVDALIMTALIFPVVYVLTYRRLLVQLRNEQEAAEALRQAYGQLQELETIVNRSPAVALVWDATDGWPVKFSTSNVEQFDYTVDELLGRKFTELMVPEDLERVAGEVGQYGDAGAATFGVQYRIVTKRGDVRWVDGRAWVQRGTDGTVTHYYGIILDITEQKEAEERVQQERLKLKSILDAMRDGVYIVSGAYELEYVNPVIAEEFGAVVGGKCYEYLHEREEPCPWCAHAALLDGQTVSREWHSPKTGRTYDLLDTPLRNVDGTVSMLKTLRDITQRKEHEKQLERTNRELRRLAQVEQEQRQLAEALAQATLSVSTSLDLNEVLTRLLAAIHSAIAFESAAILLYEGEEVTALCYPGDGNAGELAVSADGATQFFEQYPFMTGVREIQAPRLVKRADADCCDGDRGECESMCCYLVAPLYRSEQLSGAIFLAREEPPCFGKGELQRLVSFTSHAGIAINNARLFARKVKARQTADTLREASAAISRSLDLDVVLETLLDYVHRLVPYDGAEVVLLGSDDEMVIRGRRGDWPWMTEAHPGRTMVTVDDLPDLITILREQKSLVIADTREHRRWIPVKGNGAALSILAVPLIARGKTLGVCTLHKNEPNVFSAEHVELAEALAGLAAVAVQNAWLFEQVREGSERLQILSRRLVEIQESERLYIARELHDEAGQALTSLMVSLQLVEQAASDPELVRKHIAEMDRSLQGIIENLHRLAMALRPAALDHLGLEAAVRQNAETMAERYGLTIKVAPFGIDARLPRNVETILYRIVQEALTNVVRHAGASRADIMVKTRRDKIVVMIEDNGVGFDPAQTVEGEHIGLLGMRERAETLGGSLAIESTPGKGTTIVAEVPYDGPGSDR
ncbi:MAG: GAF domain-containing protein [Anaerolineae bacterium]|nr:GAF domain-containing protein [Anaerolineae bacterium]